MSTEHPDRLSDEEVANLAVWIADSGITKREGELLAREVREWRREFGGSALLNELLDSVTDDDVQAMRDHFTRTNADRRAIDALCARQGITVDELVTLVDELPTLLAEFGLTLLRLARGVDQGARPGPGERHAPRARQEP